MSRDDARSDADLLAAARQGDRAALESLLERHQGRVYRFGLKMCRDAEDAEDVLQDTLLAMARSVQDFRGASSISTWLYTIARNFCIRKRRRSRFAPEETSLDAGDAEAIGVADALSRTPEDLLIGKQVEAALDRAIGALDPKHREVLVLRDIEGLTAAEVGEVLGITPQAVKSRLHRARVAVRNHLAPVLGVSEAVPVAPGGCPDTVGSFSRYLEGEIGEDACRQMEQHLARCPRCEGACAALKESLALCRASGRQAEVPAAVQSAVRKAIRNALDAAS